MNPLAQAFRFGDLYLITQLIESIHFLDATTVEIRIKSQSHIIHGTAATELRAYLESRSQGFTV